MNTARATVVTVLFCGALAAGVTGCGKLIATSASSSKSCTLQVGSSPSVVTALVDHDDPGVRAQLEAMLLAAPPDAYIILRDLDTGNRLGSFRTPTGPALRGPTPPAPLPSDPTQAQSHIYHQEITTFDAALRRDQAQLHRTWLARLTAWATSVARETTAAQGNEPQQIAQLSGLRRGLTGAAADISSLEHIPGLHLGTRKILAILDLDVAHTTSAPPLPSGLQGVTVAITRFTGTSQEQATWRKQFTHAGARETALMTPPSSDQLTAVMEPVLNQSSSHQPGNC